MNKVEISMFLNEVENAEEKWVVREFDSEDRLIRTRVVASEEEANDVRLLWQK